MHVHTEVISGHGLAARSLPACLPLLLKSAPLASLFVPTLLFVLNGDHESVEEQVAQILAAHPWKVVCLSCGKSRHFQGLSSFCFSPAES